MGAIGSCLLDGAQYMIATATSEMEVLRFIRDLAAKKLDPDSKPFLVMVGTIYVLTMHVILG